MLSTLCRLLSTVYCPRSTVQTSLCHLLVHTQLQTSQAGKDGTILPSPVGNGKGNDKRTKKCSKSSPRLSHSPLDGKTDEKVWQKSSSKLQEALDVGCRSPQCVLFLCLSFSLSGRGRHHTQNSLEVGALDNALKPRNLNLASASHVSALQRKVIYSGRV